MAIKTKEDIMQAINNALGDDKSDEAISLVEDISDTFDDMQSRANGDGTDWKAKYEENDEAWRKKYKDRFFNSDGKGDDDGKNDGGEEDKPLTYENLFKEG